MEIPHPFYYSTHLFLVIREDTCKGRLKFFGGAKLLAFTQETSHLCYTNSKQSYRASNLTVTSPDQRLTNTHGLYGLSSSSFRAEAAFYL